MRSFNPGLSKFSIVQQTEKEAPSNDEAALTIQKGEVDEKTPPAVVDEEDDAEHTEVEEDA